MLVEKAISTDCKDDSGHYVLYPGPWMRNAYMCNGRSTIAYLGLWAIPSWTWVTSSGPRDTHRNCFLGDYLGVKWAVTLPPRLQNIYHCFLSEKGGNWTKLWWVSSQLHYITKKYQYVIGFLMHKSTFLWVLPIIISLIRDVYPAET